DGPTPPLTTPTAQLANHRGLKPCQPTSLEPFRAAVTAVEHHRHSRTPVARTEGIRRRLQHPRPDALQQVAQLLHTRSGLGDQPLTARSQLAQPRPRLLSTLGA